MLTIQALTATYRSQSKPVLHELELQVPRGEIYAILGGNGAGKTTLLRCLVGLHRITSGAIHWKQQALTNLGHAAKARLVSYMPQTTDDLWPLNVRDYVSLGRLPYSRWRPTLSQQDRTLIQLVMEQTDVSRWHHRLISELSGGERQRVRFTRALAQATELLLLDEPTAQLDLRQQHELMQLIQRIARECKLTVLLTIHDLNLASAYADRLAVLHAGRITRVGPARDVLASAELEAAYGLPLYVSDHPRTGQPWAVPAMESFK